MVALLLDSGTRQVVMFAIVDSGADMCVFPTSLATRLGLDIPNDRASTFSGSDETAQLVHCAPVQATLLPMEGPDTEANQEPLTFPLHAGFCDTLEHVGMGLLGHEGIFSRFTVVFCHPQGYFEIL